jgi:hypothetical protein
VCHQAILSFVHWCVGCALWERCILHGNVHGVDGTTVIANAGYELSPWGLGNRPQSGVTWFLVCELCFCVGAGLDPLRRPCFCFCIGAGLDPLRRPCFCVMHSGQGALGVGLDPLRRPCFCIMHSGQGALGAGLDPLRRPCFCIMHSGQGSTLYVGPVFASCTRGKARPFT